MTVYLERAGQETILPKPKKRDPPPPRSEREDPPPHRHHRGHESNDDENIRDRRYKMHMNERDEEHEHGGGGKRLSIDQASRVYTDVYGSPPGSAMLELLELKIRDAVSQTEESLRDFLTQLKDAERSVRAYLGAPTTYRDPFYAGLDATQGSSGDKKQRMHNALNADVLNGVVCQGVLDRDEPYRETMLADAVHDRNRVHLLNLCQRSKTRSIPKEKRLDDERRSKTGCYKGGQECGDGNSLIKESKIQGTPLNQATSFTSVGSIMPRFLYAEYV
jgi:hypothetical protein